MFVLLLAVLLPLTNSAAALALPAKTVALKVCQAPIMKYAHLKRLTQSQLMDLLKLSGFQGKNLKVAWAVAMKESHGNPLAHNYNPRTGDNSYGVFQINLYGSLKSRIQQYGLKSAQDLTNPVTNAQIAYQMSGHGKNFTAWHYAPGSHNPAVVYYLKAQI